MFVTQIYQIIATSERVKISRDRGRRREPDSTHFTERGSRLRRSLHTLPNVPMSKEESASRRIHSHRGKHFSGKVSQSSSVVHCYSTNLHGLEKCQASVSQVNTG